MKYLDQMNQIFKLIKYKENLTQIEDTEIEKIKEEIKEIEEFNDVLIYIYNHANLEYMYLATNNLEDNSQLAYELGLFCQKIRILEENLAYKYEYVKAEVDCFYYAYKHGLEDAFDSLINALLYYASADAQLNNRISDYKIILEILKLIEPMIKETSELNKILYKKRIGRYHYKQARIKHDIINKNDSLQVLRLFGEYQKALRGNYLDVIDYCLEIMSYPIFDQTKVKKDLFLYLYEFQKLNYSFINDETCMDAINAFNKEDYNETEYLLKNIENKYSYYNLGILYKNGYVGIDDQKAFDYFLKAYELGIIEASYHLGVMYSLGKGCNVDVDQALKYANIALQNEYYPAYGILETIDSDNAKTYREMKYQKILQKYPILPKISKGNGE